MTSWETVWSKREKNTGDGFLNRAGRKMACFGDLQRLVTGIITGNCSITGNTAVLEVGSGTGPVAEKLSEFSNRVYGVDISATAVKLTGQRGVASAVADAENLPFPCGSFDVVYSVGMVDLFNDSRAASILREMISVVSSGGRAVIVTSWSGCVLHEAVMGYLKRKKRWHYGPKRCFSTLQHLLPENVRVVKEHSVGFLFQLRFVSYLFEDYIIARRLYHGAYLLISMLLWPLNRLPGAVLVTVLEKK